MKNMPIKWFTLVELIIVITILAILATVSFLSFWSFLVWARDSTRVSDVNNIKLVLESFSADTWVFPVPTDPIDFTYSGWVVFTQWTFWKSVRINLWWDMSKTPLDPLYKNEYTYSVASNKRSYNIWFIREWWFAFNSTTLNKTYAEETPLREYISGVKWNYNWQIMHTYTGWQVYVFSLPSLITTSLVSTWVLDLTDKIVYEWESNLPASYNWKVIQVWTLKFQPKLVYSGSTLPKTPVQLEDLILNLKTSIQNPDYPTPLFSNSNFKSLVELDTDNPNELYFYWQKYINWWLWWRFKLSYPKNCKEILWSTDNKGSWQYTISSNWFDKISVYCDMDTDWGWWTRVRKWIRWQWYTEWADITKTRGIIWSELITKYTRYWTWSVWWTTVDLSWKQYWLYYKKFKTKQTQESGLCWEHTTIQDLISQITSWSRWDCSRSASDQSIEYIDILVDDLGEDIWLTNDKDFSWDWFFDDPCVINWHKTWARNVSWSSNWRIQHRIDSGVSLIALWGTSSPRCNWSTSWHWFQTNEVYVR